MGLQAVLKAVEKRVFAVVGAAGDKLPNFGFGEAARYLSEAAPRVTWVPLQGRTSEGDERTTATRTLWKRHLLIEVRIWGDDFDAVEILAAHVFAAFTRVYHGRYDVIDESWDTSGVLKDGVRAVFHMEVRLPFNDEPTKTVDGTGAPLATDITTELAQ